MDIMAALGRTGVESIAPNISADTLPLIISIISLKKTTSGWAFNGWVSRAHPR